jgi:hypothetical protein
VRVQCDGQHVHPGRRRRTVAGLMFDFAGGLTMDVPSGDSTITLHTQSVHGRRVDVHVDGFLVPHSIVHPVCIPLHHPLWCLHRTVL